MVVWWYWMKILCLTEEEYEKLIRGKLKISTDIKLRFKRFRIRKEFFKKFLELEEHGC